MKNPITLTISVTLCSIDATKTNGYAYFSRNIPESNLEYLSIDDLGHFVLHNLLAEAIDQYNELNKELTK